MIIRIKKVFLCLILLIGLFFPISAEKSQPLNPFFKETNSNLSDFSFSSKHEDTHPRKKIKKKRKTILDRKHKMRNGHTCPSF
jgi:hypothetical protein